VKIGKADVNSKGARSGHPERWAGRQEVKNLAKVMRRQNDKQIIKEEVQNEL
jgi:hypothetical protein